MSDGDVGVEHCTAPDGGKEVVVMSHQIGLSCAFGKQFVSWPVQPPANGMAANQHTLRSIKCRSVLIPVLCIRRPDSLFEDQLLPFAVAVDREFELSVLCVGELLVVVEEILSTKTGDSFGMTVRIQTPQRHVNVVNAIVADISAAEVVPPSPDTVQQILLIWETRAWGPAMPGSPD